MERTSTLNTQKGKEMTKYRVLARQSTFFVAEVEAESLKEAQTLADGIDFDDFKELAEIEWDVIDINESES